MKKVLLVVIVLGIVGLVGYKAIATKLTASQASNDTNPPVTTSAPSVFDNINSQLTALKSSDILLQSKIDQIMRLLQDIQVQLAAK